MTGILGCCCGLAVGPSFQDRHPREGGIHLAFRVGLGVAFAAKPLGFPLARGECTGDERAASLLASLLAFLPLFALSGLLNRSTIAACCRCGVGQLITEHCAGVLCLVACVVGPPGRRVVTLRLILLQPKRHFVLQLRWRF